MKRYTRYFSPLLIAAAILIAGFASLSYSLSAATPTADGKLALTGEKKVKPGRLQSVAQLADQE